MDEDEFGWFDREISGRHFADERLARRFRKLIARIVRFCRAKHSAGLPRMGPHEGSLSLFFNDRASEADILDGHFQSTCERQGAKPPRARFSCFMTRRNSIISKSPRRPSDRALPLGLGAAF